MTSMLGVFKWFTCIFTLIDSERDASYLTIDPCFLPITATSVDDWQLKVYCWVIKQVIFSQLFWRQDHCFSLLVLSITRKFALRLIFNPCTSNFCRICLKALAFCFHALAIYGKEHCILHYIDMEDKGRHKLIHEETKATTS